MDVIGVGARARCRIAPAAGRVPRGVIAATATLPTSRLLDNFRGRPPLWGRYFHCRHIAAQRLVPIQQLVMSRVRRIAKLGVLAGRTLSANRLEINRRKDGVLGLGTPRGSFLEQRYRRLTAARAMKDVNMQVRHDISPVVQASICLAPKRRLRRQSHAHD